MTGQTLKGHLDMLLLAVIRDGASHGYAMIDALRAQSGGALDIAEGTIYPALHRLERLGAIASRWDETAGRRRRVYTLTASGRRLLGRQQREWSAFARVVSSVVGGAS
jgi:PadR family transcriptional regulator PadR